MPTIQAVQRNKGVYSMRYYFTFPRNWEVEIVPAGTGQLVRFFVRKRGKTRTGISVYQGVNPDASRYWEAYPCCGKTARRFALGEEYELLKAIKYALRSGLSI
jgi:hypothetical protein